MNIQQAIQKASQFLSNSSPSALLDAQALLSHVLRRNTAHLATWPEKELGEKQEQLYWQLINRRQQGMPVAHLTGQREFWSLDFLVNDSTLIPRPETETLVEFILEKFSDREHLKLLDMGTGTGAIAIALANEKPGWEIVASEKSEQALELAGENIKHHQLENISLIASDWFNNIKADDFDIIVSNPPYIACDDPHLAQGDVRFEPKSALISGITGMNDIEHLCANAKKYLANKGCLVVEHGYNQKQQVAESFTSNGYTDIEQAEDLSGHTRMTAGKI